MRIQPYTVIALHNADEEMNAMTMIFKIGMHKIIEYMVS